MTLPHHAIPTHKLLCDVKVNPRLHHISAPFPRTVYHVEKSSSEANALLSNEDDERIRSLVKRRSGSGEIVDDTDRGASPLVSGLRSLRNQLRRGVTETRDSGETSKPMSMKFLVEAGVSLADLIGECGLTIHALYNSSLVSSYEDLVELGLTPDVAVLDRSRFSVDELVHLYGGTYETLHGTVGFDTSTLLRCKFTASELKVLGFTFARTFNLDSGRAYITANQLRSLGYSAGECSTLGMTTAMVSTMGIEDEDDAARMLGWNAQDIGIHFTAAQ